MASHHEYWTPSYDFISLMAPAAPRVSIITFNYDLLLDWCIKLGEVPARRRLLSYGLPQSVLASGGPKDAMWMTPTPPVEGPYNGSLRLFKLHGSLNWAHCLDCGRLTAFPTELLPHFFSGETYDRDCAACGSGNLEPMILPPGPAKESSKLAPLWEAAEAILDDAHQIVFVGYSMPDYDTSVKQLFHRVCSSLRLRRKEIRVIDPGAGDALSKRYEAVVGPHIAIKKSFVEAVSDAMAEARSVWSALGLEPR